MSGGGWGSEESFACSGDEEPPFERTRTPEPPPGTPPSRSPSPCYVRPQPPGDWENHQSAVEAKAKKVPEWRKKKNHHAFFA
jgi:hypothetical protein